MGKTRDLIKKISITLIKYQGKLSCKDEHNKDRNGRDLTEAEDIKKRWQEYTEAPYKTDLQDPESRWYDHSPRARHPGMGNQVCLRKHHHE